MLIAQITDLHIRLPGQKAYRVVETDRYLPPAVRRINAMDPRPDLVLVSGDLTDFGRPAEYAHLKQMLDPLAMPYYVMPGNHDSRNALRDVFVGHDYLSNADGFLHFTVDTGPVRIIALDTTVPEQSHGELCEVRLDWLAARLAEAPDTPTLIAMHHPPFDTGIAHMDAIGLRQGREALDALLRGYRHIERVVCGHVHRTVFARFGGTVASICPGVAHQVTLDLTTAGPSAFTLEPPGFHVHRWDGNRLVTHAAIIDHFPGPYPFHENGGLIDE